MSLSPSDGFTREALNGAFASKTSDNVLGGKLTLANSDSATVEDVQSVLSGVQSLSNWNQYFLIHKRINISIANLSENILISKIDVGYTPTTMINQEGVPVMGPFNLCFVKSAVDGSLPSDIENIAIFARITDESETHYKLTFLKIQANAELQAKINLGEYQVYFPVVFNGENRPTDDFIYDLIKGLHKKQVDVSFSLSCREDESEGEDVLLVANADVIELVNDDLVSVAGIENNFVCKSLILVNATENTVELKESVLVDGGFRFNFTQNLLSGRFIKLLWSPSIGNWIRE